MSDKIKVITMFEMLGTPPDYLNEMLSAHADKLGKEKGIKIISRKMSEPRKVEKSELFTSFIETELEVDSLETLMTVIFAYMPCHIEVIKPENLRMSNYDLNVFGNELIRRLHQYDEIARVAQIQNAQLAQEMQAALKNKKIVKSGKVKKKKR